MKSNAQTIGTNGVEPSRPILPAEYGVPADKDEFVTWDWVVERLESAKNYWVGTTRPDGRPHAVPVWGIWVEDTLYFDGHPDTQWKRNLAQNPAISVHLESGDEVVILEGVVEQIPHIDRERAKQIRAASMKKYSYGSTVEELVSAGSTAMRPQVVYAWSEFPKTLTRWRFREE
ncbi:MAG TPA: pyridoxamine 5'-phosphate oxidase family protein [Chloroflexia bacterium]|nr:pyridoxamine 5'-phosphate oxidase family protein [Chloroflexia bacterium]